MGIVTEHLIQRIYRQVEKHGIVVWFDPDGTYTDVVERLKKLPNTAVHRYTGSFFALRHAVDHLLNGEQPPRLVVYVPLTEAATRHALVELTSAGVVMRPGQQPPECNTALVAVARDALAAVFPAEAVAEITRQVERGQLTLADLDHLAEQGTQVQSGALAVIFGVSSPPDVALTFLADESHDAAILEKKAVSDLIHLLSETYGVDLSADDPLTSIRYRVARHILLTDFVVALGDALPESLRTARVPEGLAQRAACAQLAHAWRQRRDLAASYMRYAAQVQTELGLDTLDLPLEAWQRVETFALCEEQLQQHIEAALVERPSVERVTLARQHQAGFWAEAIPDIQARWALIAAAGEVLLQAQRVEQALKARTLWKSEQIIRAYTAGDAPWCLLDTAHRHLERHYYNFDLRPDKHATLEQLVARARQRYTAVVNTLAERLSRALHRDGFEVPDVIPQTDIYKNTVAGHLAQIKTAYFLVDALRFEMLRELASNLGDKWQVNLTPALATPPTLTEVGMAALLPGAERGLTIVETNGGIGVQVNDRLLRTRADRIKWLKDALGKDVLVVKLEELVPIRKALQTSIEAARFVVVTSQEIDTLAEGDNVPLARRTMDEVPYLLHRAFHALQDCGVQRIIVTADHGFIFGEEPEHGMRLNPPGGHTVALHRRVWIGRGGDRSDAYLRVEASDLGLGGDLEMAFPWNLAVFKVRGGARAYFHGGLSPQELVIGVLEVGLAVAPPVEGGRINWTLRPGSAKITTRFFSVTVEGRSQELLPVVPPRVRLEVRAADEVISTPVAASYGFEEATGDVVLRPAEKDPQSIEPNTITLMVTRELIPQQVSIYLVDAATGVALAPPLKIPLDIAL